jgi:predicted ATPase
LPNSRSRGSSGIWRSCAISPNRSAAPESIDRARTEIESALARSTGNEELWYIAELLRIKGELILRETAANAAAMAEEQFQQSLDWPRRQGALSRELQTATSLGRLWQERGEHAAARAMLAPIYVRFTEGLRTVDLRAAKMVFDALP